jgi:hypothetical protein
MQPQNKQTLSPQQPQREEKEELKIASFDEVETPDADIVSLGSASYTKMLGKIYT